MKMKEHTSEFRGIDWSNSLHRPGCQDHLNYPSLRDGKKHAYKEPIINTSSVKQFGAQQYPIKK